eukprot:SAG31_NODE_28431_length_410_cov_0.990354_1_plen_56_part_01
MRCSGASLGTGAVPDKPVRREIRFPGVFGCTAIRSIKVGAPLAFGTLVGPLLRPML